MFKKKEYEKRRKTMHRKVITHRKGEDTYFNHTRSWECHLIGTTGKVTIWSVFDTLAKAQAFVTKEENHRSQYVARQGVSWEIWEAEDRTEKKRVRP